MICTIEQNEKYTELTNMIIKAFNESMTEIHEINKNPKPFRKYAPVLTKLTNKLIEISKYYKPYNMDDDYINCLNHRIEYEYEYMLIFIN